MLVATNGKSRLGATVHQKYSEQFAHDVSWQKIDEKTGAPAEEEDIVDNGEIPGADEGETPVTPDPGTGGGGTDPNPEEDQ